MRHHLASRSYFCMISLCGLLAVSACGAPSWQSEKPDATQLRVAAAAMSAGRPETAVQVLSEHLQRNPGDLDALLQRGQAFNAMGQPAEAAQDFARVIAAKPRSADALTGLARARMAQGRAEEAEASWRKALALRPEDARIQTGLAVALDIQGRHGEAQRIYKTLLARNPDDVAARADLGYSLALSGRTGDALPLLQSVVRAGADGEQSGLDARMRHNLAVGLMLAGDEAAARKVLGQDLSPLEIDAAVSGLRRFASAR